MKLTGFPANIDINPRDRREIAFVKDFRNENRETGVKLSVDSISIVNEAYAELLTWLYNTTLGFGRFENIPAQALTSSGTIIPMYLDLQRVNIGLNDAEVGINVRKSDGHFFTDANVLTFELLRLKGFLPDSLAIDVPYIIVPDDLRQQRGITIIGTISLVYQILDVVFKLGAVVASFTDLPFGILAAILESLFLAIMLVVLIIQLQIMFNLLKELYFPSLRFFKAFRDVDLIRQGCLYLGYTLDSELLNIDLNKLSTMGVPEAVAGKSIFQLFENEQTQFFNKGYPTAQDSVPTLGSLIAAEEETFNAKTFVYGGTVKIERRSYYQGTASIIIDPTLSEQGTHDDRYTPNESEAWGRMYNHWQVDYTDAHSPDSYAGMKSEHITEPITTLNPDLVRLIGLKEDAAPFALAGRKNVLTRTDQIIKQLFGQFYALANAGGGSVGGSIFNDNIGVMVLSQQYFSSTKKLWLDINGQGFGLQPSNYKDILSMDNLYNLFKTDLEVKNNNYAVKTMTVPFTDENFISLLMNNFVILKTGEVVEITNIKWFDEKWKAEIEILLPDNSAFNTKTTKLA